MVPARAAEATSAKEASVREAAAAKAARAAKDYRSHSIALGLLPMGNLYVSATTTRTSGVATRSAHLLTCAGTVL